MKPTFVLVVGSWHTAACYDPLIKALADASYASVAVAPRCLNSSPPATSFQPDADAIKDAISGLSGDVILVMHSYGGVVGTSAVGDLVANQPEVAARIRRLVYLAAFVPVKGENLWEAFTAAPIPPPEPYLDIKDGYVTLKDNAAEIFYHDVPEPERSQYVGMLGKHPAAANTTAVERLGYEHVPSTYIVTTLDRALSIEYQRWAVERVRSCVRERVAAGEAVTEPFGGELGVIPIESGHSVMVSKPGEFAGVLGKLAERG